MEYLVLIIITAFYANRFGKNPNFKKYRGIYIAIFIYSIVMWGFRYRVGIDTLNYMEDYGEMPSLSKLDYSHIFEYRAAPFYTMLVAICKSISPSFYLLQIAVTTIFNLCLFIFLKKYSQNPFHAFLIFFFMTGGYFNTEILKESLAVGFFLLNLDNLLNNRLGKYYLLATVSLMFHYSAIIVFLFPLLKWLRFNMYFFLILIVFFLVSKQLSGILLPMITFEAVANRLDEFSKMMENGQLNINWVIVEVTRTSVLPFCLLLVNRYKKWKLDNKEFLICLCVIFGIGCIYFEIIFDRFCNYLIIIFVVCFSNMLTSKTLSKQLCIIFVFMFIGIYTFYYFNHHRYRMWYPYISILNEHKDMNREKLWYEFFPYQ